MSSQKSIRLPLAAQQLFHIGKSAPVMILLTGCIVYKFDESAGDSAGDSAPDTVETPAIVADLDENLLVNPGLETGDFSGWIVVNSGGDGWLARDYATSPNGVGDFGDFGQYGANTSYGWCRRAQIVDLIALGFTAEFLDSQPYVNVSDWFLERYDVDEYMLRVTLLDENGATLSSWAVHSYTSGTVGWDDDAWVEASHSFSGYGAGLRYITFFDGGQDTEWWAGQYGVLIDNSYLALSDQPL